jgi:hypothetical protein
MTTVRNLAALVFLFAATVSSAQRPVVAAPLNAYERALLGDWRTSHSLNGSPGTLYVHFGSNRDGTSKFRANDGRLLLDHKWSFHATGRGADFTIKTQRGTARFRWLVWGKKFVSLDKGHVYVR